MKINRICAMLFTAIAIFSCTTLVYGSEKNIFTPEYRLDKEFEVELEPVSIYSFEGFSSPTVKIGYTYSEKVTAGTVRYISQITRSKYFNTNYWGKWDGSTSIKCANGSWYGGPGQECFTSCISMSLSYIGVNKTPKDILDFGGGITIVNTSWGGAKYSNPSFATAVKNYLDGNGKYSPPIIHLNNYTYAGHYVVVIGKSTDNTYQVLDPAKDSVYDLTMSGNTATYTNASGATCTDTVTSAHQYYKEDVQLVRPFLCHLDMPVASGKYEEDITIRGWAIYGKELTKVTAYVNGKSVDLMQSPRIDVAAAHPGYPTGKEGFSGTIPADLLINGNNKLKVCAYYQTEEFHVSTIQFTYENKEKPVISDVNVEQDEEGYTITCKVSDEYGIDRVQFPTWTELNNQDDLPKDWTKGESSKGELSEGIVSFRVNRSEHNNERGVYNTHIYAYDIHGNYSVEKIQCVFEVEGPSVCDVVISKAQEGLNVSSLITDYSGISGADYEIYKMTAEGDEPLASGSFEFNSEEEPAKSEFVTTLVSLDTLSENDEMYRIDISTYDIYDSKGKHSFVFSKNNIFEVGPIDEVLQNNSIYMLYEEMENVKAEDYCKTIGGIYHERAVSDDLLTLFPHAPENSFICQIPFEGSCGEELFYSVSGDSLTIKGTGTMYHWSDEDVLPWKYFTPGISKVIVESDVTEVNLDGYNECLSMLEIFILGKETKISHNGMDSDIIIYGQTNSAAESFAANHKLTFITMTGDLNKDRKVNAADALAVLKHAASIEVIADELLLECADVDCDGAISATDALQILRIVAGI